MCEREREREREGERGGEREGERERERDFQANRQRYGGIRGWIWGEAVPASKGEGLVWPKWVRCEYEVRKK